MGEVIVYRLSKMVDFIMFCLTATIILEFLFFYLTREDEFTPKHAKIYGLLTNLGRVDTLMLSVSYMRMLVVLFYAFNSKLDIIIYIVLILILSTMFLIYNIKKFIIEIINSGASILGLYLINILTNYQIDVENNIYVSTIKIALITFICFYGIYVFMSNIEDIIYKNENVRRNANEKE